MKETRLHIIEQTLENETGHCFSFISSLASSAVNQLITVWCSRKAAISLPGNIEIKRYFYRRLRRLQSVRLFRKLLQTEDSIFISTASRIDIMLMDLAAKKPIPPGKVFMYIHWFYFTPGKRAHIQKIAKRQPEIIILTPSVFISEEFKKAGFTHTEYVSYPITPRDLSGLYSDKAEFRHLLFAGAARQDKGFSKVVDLIEHLCAKKERIPVLIQSSPEHYNKYDKQTKSDIARLEKCSYPFLEKRPATLPGQQYLEMFNGGISLQLYSRNDFADRISGVTLDSLSCGCPVIATSGTWTARTVSEYDAGIVVGQNSADQILAAIKNIMNDYGKYQQNAFKAGRDLQIKHHPRNLADKLFEKHYTR